MPEFLRIATAVVALALAAWAGYAAWPRPAAAAAAVSIGVVVLELFATGAGRPRRWSRLADGITRHDLATFIGYLVAFLVIPPAGLPLARLEPTRWGSVIIAVARPRRGDPGRTPAAGLGRVIRDGTGRVAAARHRRQPTSRRRINVGHRPGADLRVRPLRAVRERPGRRCRSRRSSTTPRWRTCCPPLAAVIYWSRRSAWPDPPPASRRLGIVCCSIELVGVLVVGTASHLWHGRVPGRHGLVRLRPGYGYVPLVLPILGLWWLLRRSAAPAAADPSENRVPHRGMAAWHSARSRGILVRVTRRIASARFFAYEIRESGTRRSRLSAKTCETPRAHEPGAFSAVPWPAPSEDDRRPP